MTPTQIDQLIKIADDLGQLIDNSGGNVKLYEAWDIIVRFLEMNTDVDFKDRVHCPTG